MSKSKSKQPCGYYSNASEILPGLWIGDLKAALDRSFLKDKQIECVINCTKVHPFGDDSMIIVKQRVSLGKNIGDHDKLLTKLDHFADIIKKNIKKYNVLVHCYSGKEKSATIIISYLIKYGLMTPNAALLSVKSKKPNILSVENVFIYHDILRQYAKKMGLNSDLEEKDASSDVIKTNKEDLIRVESKPIHNDFMPSNDSNPTLVNDNYALQNDYILANDNVHRDSYVSSEDSVYQNSYVSSEDNVHQNSYMPSNDNYMPPNNNIYQYDHILANDNGYFSANNNVYQNSYIPSNGDNFAHQNGYIPSNDQNNLGSTQQSTYDTNGYVEPNNGNTWVMPTQDPIDLDLNAKEELDIDKYIDNVMNS